MIFSMGLLLILEEKQGEWKGECYVKDPDRGLVKFCLCRYRYLRFIFLKNKSGIC